VAPGYPRRVVSTPLLRVLDLGLACCALEFLAAAVRTRGGAELGLDLYPAGPEQADVLVVSGTVTDAMAPLVLDAYARMPPTPRRVVSFGACANTGGPYWDSPWVTKGVDRLIPVDVYVPGCPPRPEALLETLVALRAGLAGA
jgi:NADH-quinone oxidoreductase subunit B